MKMDSTCDAYSYVDELYKELQPIYRKLEKIFNADVEIFTTFRLIDRLGYKSSVRFTKKDRTLWLDFVVYSDEYDGLQKCEQRHKLSHDHFEFLAMAIRKYRFEGLNPDEFLREYEQGLVEIGWRKEDWEVAMEAAGM